MSFDLPEYNISTQKAKKYGFQPPFFGEDRWVIDPIKIVTRPPKNILPVIPEEEEVDIDETVKNTPEMPTKRLRFASYVNVHTRCPIIDAKVRYPSKMIEDLKRENTLLKDDLLITEKRIERLESMLKRTQQALIHAHTINDALAIWLVMMLLAGLIIAYKYIEMNL